MEPAPAETHLDESSSEEVEVRLDPAELSDGDSSEDGVKVGQEPLADVAPPRRDGWSWSFGWRSHALEEQVAQGQPITEVDELPMRVTVGLPMGAGADDGVWPTPGKVTAETAPPPAQSV